MLQFHKFFRDFSCKNERFGIIMVCTIMIFYPTLAQCRQCPNYLADSANREAYLDRNGVLRWVDNEDEVALFGINYCVPSAAAFRMLKRVDVSHYDAVDQDMVHFYRMGLDALRLSFWGDWECSDTRGNLIENEHLKVLDYVIYQGKKRGMYMLLSPIILYNSAWPDVLGRSASGFAGAYPKQKMGTDPNAIKAQVNYLGQIMQHVNVFSGVAYKDESAILGVELVNEPHHHPEDHNNSAKYINTLYTAVRDSGFNGLILFIVYWV